MGRRYVEEEMAKVYLPNGMIKYYPMHLLDRVEALSSSKLPTRDYVDYKEGAKVLCMSERTLFDLAKNADAKRKIGGKVLINLRVLYDYIEKYCVD